MELQTAAGAAEQYIPPRARSARITRVVVYLVLGGIAALYFVPFLWSLSTSFKTLPDTAYFSLLPHHWVTSAYHDVLSKYSFATYFKNSAFLAAVITLSNVFLAGLGGYAFARLRFPGREVLFLFVLGTLMIPDQLRLVPVFVTLTNWHLVSTFKAYIFIKLIEATNLFFMRQYFLTIPKDFEEAAKLDGAGYFKTFWKVMLPLAGPAIAAVTILEFQGIWNDFFWPSIILGFGNPHVYTIQLGITQFIFQYGTLWPQLMAASVLAILPIAVIFVIFQRYFIAGVVASGVKG